VQCSTFAQNVVQNTDYRIWQTRIDSTSPGGQKGNKQLQLKVTTLSSFWNLADLFWVTKTTLDDPDQSQGHKVTKSKWPLCVSFSLSQVTKWPILFNCTFIVDLFRKQCNYSNIIKTVLSQLKASMALFISYSQAFTNYNDFA